MAHLVQHLVPRNTAYLVHICSCDPLQGSQHDISLLEGIIDSLLSDLTAEDQMSLSMHHYMHFMQLLQWALQCMWSLHSSAATLLTATTLAFQATVAFNQALQQYVKAVHVDIRAVANGNINTAGPESEPLRINLRPIKRAANSAYKQLQVCHASCTCLSLRCLRAALLAEFCIASHQDYKSPDLVNAPVLCC